MRDVCVLTSTPSISLLPCGGIRSPRAALCVVLWGCGAEGSERSLPSPVWMALLPTSCPWSGTPCGFPVAPLPATTLLSCTLAGLAPSTALLSAAPACAEVLPPGAEALNVTCSRCCGRLPVCTCAWTTGAERCSEYRVVLQCVLCVLCVLWTHHCSVELGHEGLKGAKGPKGTGGWLRSLSKPREYIPGDRSASRRFENSTYANFPLFAYLVF
jgi:hypothetical protein